jgi:hypothetical protein
VTGGDTGAVLPLLRRGYWYRSHDRIPAPGGAQLCLAPEILVRDDAARFRAADRPPPPAAERPALLRAAVELFVGGTVPVAGVGVQGPAEFADVLRAAAGLPPVLVARWSAALARHLDRAPAPVADDRVLAAVSLPANTFTCLEAVLDALLVTGGVWIRPSRREPFSSARLVGALLTVGWPAERLGYYPTEPAVLPALIRVTDRQVVYGGDAVAGLAGPALEVRGPGRACALVPPDADPQVLVPWLAGLVASDSGRFCTNACVIVGSGDVAGAARGLARVLDGIRLDPPDPALPVAAVPRADAERIARFVDARLGPGARRLTRRPLVVEVGGRSHLAPTLVEVDRVDHPLVGCELPFPFAVAVRTDPAGTARVTRRSRFVHAAPQAALVEGAPR